jgi:hypothetical protein
MSSPFLSLLEKETVASFLSLVPVVAGWKGTAPVALEEEKKANMDVVSGTMMVAGRGC